MVGRRTARRNNEELVGKTGEHSIHALGTGLESEKPGGE